VDTPRPISGSFYFLCAMAPRPGRRSSFNSRTLVNLDIYPTRYRAHPPPERNSRDPQKSARVARAAPRIFMAARARKPNAPER